MYKDNFGETPEGDITQIKSSDIPAHDVLCGGFPCQPFSISGKQMGFGDVRGTLFNDIIRIAKYHQPKYLFLENVANMVKHDNGNTIDTIIYELDKANYITHKQVLNASYFGIPQARKRLYFICVRKDFANKVMFSFPKPTYENISLKDIALHDKEIDKLTVKRNDITLENNKIKLCKTNILKPLHRLFESRWPGRKNISRMRPCNNIICLWRRCWC